LPNESECLKANFAFDELELDEVDEFEIGGGGNRDKGQFFMIGSSEVSRLRRIGYQLGIWKTWSSLSMEWHQSLS